MKKTINSNDFDSEFAYDFDDYGPYSKSHPFRLYKYDKTENQKTSGKDKQKKDEIESNSKI